MIQIKKITELTGHSGAVYAIEQIEAKNAFYSGSSDKIVAKWSLSSFTPEKFSAQLPSIIYTLCGIGGKNILLSGTSEGKIHVIDLKEKREIKTLQNHLQPVFDIKYSPQHNILLSAGGDGVLSVISSDDFTTYKLLKLCNEKLRAIAIYGNEAAIACGDGRIRILDLKELRLKNEFEAHTGSVYSVTFSPDGNYLLSGGKDAHLKKWLIRKEAWSIEKSIPAHNYAIYSIVYSPDGKMLATASRDKTIKIWNANTAEILSRINKENFEGHAFSVNKLFWSQHNDYLLSASDDKKIMVWEIKQTS